MKYRTTDTFRGGLLAAVLVLALCPAAQAFDTEQKLTSGTLPARQDETLTCTVVNKGESAISPDIAFKDADGNILDDGTPLIPAGEARSLEIRVDWLDEPIEVYCHVSVPGDAVIFGNLTVSSSLTKRARESSQLRRDVHGSLATLIDLLTP